MKILVIGGSYFYGRVFVMEAIKDHQITVLNRGNMPLGIREAQQIRCDRRDLKAVAELREEEYDVIVDFCGYLPGDIKDFIENFPGKTKQYIFVSTVDVYKKWTGLPLTEEAPLEDRIFSGSTGDYIHRKLLLEKEGKEICESKGIDFTIVRPAILYGPMNYTERETGFIRSVVKEQPILCPVDAEGSFQLVYVKDAAVMLLALCRNEKAYGESFNLAPEEDMNYPRFFQVLDEVADIKPKIVTCSLEEALKENAHLPFPVTKEEKEHYVGTKITEVTGLSYTPLAEGLLKTWKVFKPVFS